LAGGETQESSGRTLGRKGGRKRAEKRGWEKIPAQQGSELARTAVLARWTKARTKISCE